MTVRTSDLGGTDWADGDTLFAADLNDTFGAATIHRKQFSDSTDRTTTSTSFVDSGTEFTLSIPVNSIVLGFFTKIELTTSNGEVGANLQISGTNLGTTYLRRWQSIQGIGHVNSITLNSTESDLINTTGGSTNFLNAGFTPLKILDASTTLKIRFQSSSATTATLKSATVDVIYIEVFKED